MLFHLRKTGLWLWAILCLPLAFAGCVTDAHQQSTASGPSTETSASAGTSIASPSTGAVPSSTPAAVHSAPEKTVSHFPEMDVNDDAFLHHENGEHLTSFPRANTAERSNQELLDSALEFCNASNDFWEQGDLENAIDALDESYSIILKINSDKSPEIQQQMDDLRFTISQRILQVYSSRFTVLNGNHKAIPLDMNPHVKKALDLYKGRYRKSFLAAYRRSGKYRPFIVKRLKEAGLPKELSWLPLIESGFTTRALSRARALGMWQFIASTGYKYGLKRDRWVDERMDPEKSTEAAIAYMKELHQIFGDWDTVLAAYNCGEGRVLRTINSQKINYLDHFWDLYSRLPSETAFYVPKFLAVLHIVNDPKAHGFVLPPVDKPLETETVTIDRQISLKSMAAHIGVSPSVLRKLNPSLKHRTTPPRPYAFRVPEGKREVLLAELGQMPDWRPPVRPAYKHGTATHRVRKGETLSTIARRYGTSVKSIMRANSLKSSRYIKAGWKLKVPVKKRYVSTRKTAAPAISSKKGHSKARSSATQQYAVRKGDSLWKIANRFRTTTKAIQTANRMSGTALSIGQALIIPSSLPTTGGEAETASYRVLKGDSPYIIARKHQMNLSTFLRLNRLTPRSTIFPGQVLRVKVK
ncbi:MAG: LysM peptidoglycan-binding domain-containing protein [Deltaproteobacteria bacterium]|nr:LysM peptidoglycan-binding domain-containing protein [Deltaproteobacteria bacterium]